MQLSDGERRVLCSGPSGAENSRLHAAVLNSRSGQTPISPHFKPAVNRCLLASAVWRPSLTPPLTLRHLVLDSRHPAFANTPRSVHAHTHTPYKYTHAHLGQRRRRGRDGELWVTDLAKVAYAAWPKPHRENPIELPPGPRGAGDAEFGEASCRAKTSQRRGRMRNRGFWVSLPPERKDERRGGRG